MRHLSQLDDEAIDAFRAGITWPKFWERYKADILRLHRPTAEFIAKLFALVVDGKYTAPTANAAGQPVDDVGTKARPQTTLWDTCEPYE